jgi:hypothetical protein
MVYEMLVLNLYYITTRATATASSSVLHGGVLRHTELCSYHLFLPRH